MTFTHIYHQRVVGSYQKMCTIWRKQFCVVDWPKRKWKVSGTVCFYYQTNCAKFCLECVVPENIHTPCGGSMNILWNYAMTARNLSLVLFCQGNMF